MKEHVSRCKRAKLLLAFPLGRTKEEQNFRKKKAGIKTRENENLVVSCYYVRPTGRRLFVSFLMAVLFGHELFIMYVEDKNNKRASRYK